MRVWVWVWVTLWSKLQDLAVTRVLLSPLAKRVRVFPSDANVSNLHLGPALTLRGLVRGYGTSADLQLTPALTSADLQAGRRVFYSLRGFWPQARRVLALMGTKRTYLTVILWLFDGL